MAVLTFEGRNAAGHRNDLAGLGNIICLCIDGLSGLGDETDRRVTAEDVTEIVIDLVARLKNKIALRDRLRKLLDRAQDVKEVLVVEEQLTRIQSEIDSMETDYGNFIVKARRKPRWAFRRPWRIPCRVMRRCE